MEGKEAGRKWSTLSIHYLQALHIYYRVGLHNSFDPLLQTKSWKLRELKNVGQSHPARKGQKSRVPDSKFMYFLPYHPCSKENSP